ncbi:MAG TPA: RNA-binding protein [Peptococcaceae bacterium]|nr:MAG: S4-domain-containing heat shock protein [Clostridia bacterium 41_269]HBT20679.1 RNA-binding protein [Peptococcaceae bacterium]
MRLDKFLKVSRIIKRRTVAKELCSAGKVSVNSRTAKAGTEIKEGDIISIDRGDIYLEVEVLSVPEKASVSNPEEVYRLIKKEKRSLDSLF